MFQLLIRILMVASGFFASFFVARDALKFELVQMVCTVIIFTFIVAILAFGPMLYDQYKDKHKKKHLYHKE